MNKFLNRKVASITGAVVLFTGVFSLGIFIGNNTGVAKIAPNVLNKTSPEVANTDFDSFWKVWRILDEKYVSGNGSVSDQERVYGAIQGLVGALDDPYTVFFPPKEAEIFESDIAGEFQGVGMEIGIRDDVLTVVAPLKNTPAESAGVRPGDKIVEIDGTSTKDLAIDEAVLLIRGEKGTVVSLTVVREGEDALLTIDITRDVIVIPTIGTEVRDGSSAVAKDDGAPENQNDVFVISLYNFSAQSPNLFRESLREFILSEKNKLILDLRGNPGGYLEASVDMASWFLPSGKIILKEEFAEGTEGRVYRSKGYNVFNDNLKMVVLIDGGSASASEILAGALSEHGVATLVGTQTFGKGSVQELIPITDKTSVKVTVARWLTPDGTSISKKGITPDIEVKINKEDFEAGRDPQLEKAIEILGEM